MTMFNPNVKRVLDVGLVHTLVHDSLVSLHRGPVRHLIRAVVASSVASSFLPTAKFSRPDVIEIRRSTILALVPRLRTSHCYSVCQPLS